MSSASTTINAVFNLNRRCLFSLFIFFSCITTMVSTGLDVTYFTQTRGGWDVLCFSLKPLAQKYVVTCIILFQFLLIYWKNFFVERKCLISWSRIWDRKIRGNLSAMAMVDFSTFEPKNFAPCDGLFSLWGSQGQDASCLIINHGIPLAQWRLKIRYYCGV